MPDLNKEEQKQLYKEAIKEFLEAEKSKMQQQVGRWAINLFLASVVGALIYLTAWANGWRHN